MRTWVVSCLFVCALAAANTAAAGPITFDFNTGSGQQYGPLTNTSCTFDHNCSSSPFTMSSRRGSTLHRRPCVVDYLTRAASRAGHSGAELGSHSIGLGV